MRVNADVAAFEMLEPRRLLSADGGGDPTYEIAWIEWQDRQIEMAAGQWMVSLTKPIERFEDGSLVYSERVHNHGKVPNEAHAAAMEQLAAKGITFGKYLGHEDLFLIHAPVDATHEQLVQDLAIIPDVRWVEPNAIIRLDPMEIYVVERIPEPAPTATEPDAEEAEQAPAEEAPAEEAAAPAAALPQAEAPAAAPFATGGGLFDEEGDVLD